MAAKYQSNFTSLTGQDWRVEIYERGVSNTTPLNIELADFGFMIEWQGKGDTLFDNPIKASRANIPYIVTNADDFNFFTDTLVKNPENYYDIVINKVSGSTLSLYWVGTILADQITFERKAIEQKQVINIVAVDGLSRLENFEIDFVTGTTFRKNGIAIIYDIFAKVGTSEYWASSTPMIADGVLHKSGVKSTSRNLEYIQFNQLQFRGGDVFEVDVNEIEPKNAKEILEIILKTFNAQIILSSGVYYIRQVLPYKNTNYSFRTYDSTGSYITSSSITTAYSINDGSANARPVFESNPTISYQPPVAGAKSIIEKKSGSAKGKTIFDYTLLTNSNIDCSEEKPFRLRLNLTTEYIVKRSGQRFYLLVGIHISNGSNTKSWSKQYGWIDGTSYSQYEYSEKDYAGNRLELEVTTSAPPAGYNKVGFTVDPRKDVLRYVYNRNGASWIVAGGVGNVVQIQFSGYAVIEQAINNSNPIEFTKNTTIYSTAESPRNTKNSITPKINFLSTAGNSLDVFSLLAYNGTAWNAVNTWVCDDINASLSAELPSINNRAILTMYKDFVPSISGIIHDNGSYEVHRCISYDSVKWIFNGGTFSASIGTYNAEWLGFYSDVVNVTETVERKAQTKDFTEKLRDIKLQVNELKADVSDSKFKVMESFFLESSGTPTSEPSGNLEFVMKILYNNTTKGLEPMLEARTQFGTANTRNVLIDCGTFDEAGRAKQVEINCGTF